MTTVVLVTLAIAFAGPVPWSLSHLPALRRTPRPTMVLWQSVALAAVLAALGAGLSLVTAQVDGDRSVRAYAVSVLALALTGLVVARLLLSGHRVGTRLRMLRRRHRMLVDLLAEDRGRRPGAGARRAHGVLPARVPVAGGGQSRCGGVADVAGARRRAGP